MFYLWLIKHDSSLDKRDRILESERGFKVYKVIPTYKGGQICNGSAPENRVGETPRLNAFDWTNLVYPIPRSDLESQFYSWTQKSYKSVYY